MLPHKTIQFQPNSPIFKKNESSQAQLPPITFKMRTNPTPRRSLPTLPSPAPKKQTPPTLDCEPSTYSPASPRAPKFNLELLNPLPTIPLHLSLPKKKRKHHLPSLPRLPLLSDTSAKILLHASPRQRFSSKMVNLENTTATPPAWWVNRYRERMQRLLITWPTHCV